MISWLSNQKIGAKFGILGSSVITLMIVAAIGMVEIGKTGYLQFLEREHIEFVLLMRIKLEQIREQVEDPNASVDTALLTANSSERLEMGLQPLLDETLALPIACLDAVNGLEKFVFTLIGFGEAFELCENDIVDLKEAGRIIEDYRHQNISSTAFVESFNTYLSLIQKNSRRFSIIVPKARDTVKSIILTATLMLSLFVLGLFLLIANMLRQPIMMMAARIKEIAEGEGDLTRRLEIASHDEIGAVAHWFNLFIEKLQEVMINVKRVTNNVAAGSQAVSSSAALMSQGASSQAASAEEASSSMEEMVGNIRQNTENALQTEKLAVQAAADSGKSGQAVAEAVNAMQQIAQKISVIEDITHQTRMLSLNAAIEAARAQEHGQGFAVVAAEVQDLADRSRNAATEINKLAETSVRVAETAGEMLQRLVPDIQKTAALVQDISSASEEQNSGADQINQAIQQLDGVTQQNAAASEELAATAGELVSQSEKLQEIIAFFYIGET